MKLIVLIVLALNIACASSSALYRNAKTDYSKNNYQIAKFVDRKYSASYNAVKPSYKTPAAYREPTPAYRTGGYGEKAKVEYLNAYKTNQINLQDYLDRNYDALMPLNEKLPYQPLVGVKETDDGRQVIVVDRYDPYKDLQTVHVSPPPSYLPPSG